MSRKSDQKTVRLSQTNLKDLAPLQLILIFSTLFTLASSILDGNPFPFRSRGYYFTETYWMLRPIASILFFLYFVFFLIEIMKADQSMGKPRAESIEAAGFMCIIAGLAFGLLYYYLGPIAIIIVQPGDGYFSPNYFPNDWLFFVAIPFLLSVVGAIILSGALFTQHSKYFTNDRLWLSTGILYMLAGILKANLFLDFPGNIILVAAGISGFQCLRRSGASHRLRSWRN